MHPNLSDTYTLTTGTIELGKGSGQFFIGGDPTAGARTSALAFLFGNTATGETT
jgi:hypothetical protein